MAIPNRDLGVTVNPANGLAEYWDGTTMQFAPSLPAGPASIPNLVLWLDANQITGQADNTTLTTWPNLAVGGAVATQSNASWRPTFRIINGVPQVTFPASGVSLPVTFGSAQVTDERTTFIVAYNSGAVTTRQIMYHLGPDDASAAAQQTYSLEMEQGVIDGRQSAPRPTGLAVPTTVAVMAFAGSVSGAGFPEGVGMWTYLNGRRTFRTQDQSQQAYTSVTGITGGVIGALATGQGSYRFLGGILAVLDYNRRLTEAEIQRLTVYLATVYGAASPLALPTRNLVCDGDSLTVGYQGTVYGNGYVDALAAQLPATVRNYNLGILGQTAVQMAADATTQVDPLYDPIVAKNTVVAWAGTNDMGGTPSAPTVPYNALVSYCQARRSRGFKVAVLTCLPRGATSQFETDRQVFNALVRANWRTFADALVDVGADATIGLPGAQNNATYYQGDAIHLTPAGYQVVANLALPAVNNL